MKIIENPNIPNPPKRSRAKFERTFTYGGGERKVIDRNLSLPSNSRLMQRAREMRKGYVLSEVLFWNRVKSNQVLDLDFDRQKVIGNYIVDFYIKRIGVAIEIDGSSHNDKEEYDRNRDNYLRGLGVSVLHYADREVKQSLDGVIQHLIEFIVEYHTKPSIP